MRQPGGDVDFSQEPVGFKVTRATWSHDLDGDLPPVPLIVRQEYQSHAPGADHVPDSIPTCQRLLKLLQQRHRRLAWLVDGLAGGRPRFNQRIAGHLVYIAV